MGVSFVGAGSPLTQQSPGTGTVPLPTGTGEESGPEDYMLLVWTTRGNSCTPNTPADWTLIDSHTNTNANINRIYIFGRRAADQMVAPEITVNGTGTNNTMIAQIFTFGGVTLDTEIEVAPVWTDSNGLVQDIGPLTAVDSLAADAMAVAIAHKSDDWTSVAPSGTWLEASEQDATVGTDAGINVAYKKMPTAATTATYTGTVTGGTTDEWTGCILVLGARTGTTSNKATFEGGTNGNTVVPQSAACPELSIVSGSGTCVYSNAHPHRGALGILIDPTSGSERVKFNNAIPGPVMYARAYLWMSALPGAALRIMELEDYPGTSGGSVAIGPTGLLRVQTSGGGNVVNSGHTMVAQQMYRLEVAVNITANTTTLRIYTGAKLESVGTDYTDTCQTSVSAGVPWLERAMYGAGTAATLNMYWDDVAYSTSDWIGPALDNPVGIIDATLPSLTVAAAGSVSVTGTASVTLPVLTSDLNGAVSVSGASAHTLPSLSAAALASVTVDGPIAHTLPALVADADGQVSAAGVSGAIAATLPSLTADVAGSLTVSGSAAVALPSLAADAAGAVSLSGSVSATLPALTAGAAGAVTVDGPITHALPAIEVAATGTVATTGATMNVILPSLTDSLTGGVTVDGTAGVTLPALSAAATGTVAAAAVTGDLDATLPALAVVAAAEAVVAAALGAVLPSLTVQMTEAAPVVITSPSTQEVPNRYAAASPTENPYAAAGSANPYDARSYP